MQGLRRILAVLCVLAIAQGDASLLAQATAPAGQAAGQAATIPPEQLDSLVAPIALYPDPLLSQTLVASTYPLEIMQLQQWLAQNKNLKDKALADAVQKQDWDPSIQALATFPDVVKQLAENVKWTTDLGNAFLAQQSDVMDAVQRMRKKAKDAGNLKSNEQQKVETKTVENKTVVVIEQASPQVVYVPSYNPTVVYGAPAYPYPPIAYPPPGYYAAGMAISFGIGVAMGAGWGGGWGYGCGWGNNDVDINVNNNYVKNSNRQSVNTGNRPANQPAGGKWQHNPQHRGGAPYPNQRTAQQFGGTARGDSMARRQENARQNQAQRGNRQQAGASDRSRQQGGAGDRGRQQAGVSDRSANTRDAGDRGGAGGNRQQAGVSDRSANTRDTGNRGGGGGDRVGNRDVPSGASANNRSAFGGASGGASGNQARASSQRGSSSMSGRSGGGRSGGGGGGRSGGGGGGRRR